MSKWMIATNNEGKLLEFKKFFEGKVYLESFKSIGKKSPEEPHKTFLENALEKARYASLVSRLPSIADDSGLVVDYLGGLPGVRSARFASVSSGRKRQQDEENIKKLLGCMRSAKTFAQRRCRFITMIVALKSHDDPDPIVSRGVWEGLVAFEPKGERGFGYDPIFYLPEEKKTAAQLLLHEKTEVSHRGKALKKISLELFKRFKN
ncbi:RdgB/HAM1 family non-canonical purine NTP pyrophosphatase [Betaproteobacteria bacterium]|nr:RdgB/HAM1 family non-canonical purine NTP pyrophosphatase [Betaproteobacteria bacterium]